jgi:glycosyltransferase involved in cell wall biosynthesis
MQLIEQPLIEPLRLIPAIPSLPNTDGSSEVWSVPMAVRPLRLAFVITSMPVGGAETLLLNLVRRLDRVRIAPEIVCLKEPGPLGEILAEEVPFSHSWLRSKYDISVLWKLSKHFRHRQIDAVVTVGAGDKMFWGRLAAKAARVTVVGSALHSTGWPDGVGRLNRMLTPITDVFIAVAQSHGQFMVDFERFPAERVTVIRNGIDTDRFVPDPLHGLRLRQELGVPAESQLVGVVAAMRPEKNLPLFLEVAERVVEREPQVHFVMVGDGPERPAIEKLIATKGLQHRVHLLGSRSDTPRLLAAWDVFLLTSHNEANPVSILEALACGVPVVSTRVGSVAETVQDGKTGFTVDPGNAEAATERVRYLLAHPREGKKLGEAGRRLVQQTGSLSAMVAGYQDLIETIFARKRINPGWRLPDSFARKR